MKCSVMLGVVACAVAGGAMASNAQAQSMGSLFAECRPGYTYDLGKNMCMLDKKAKKVSKKKASKKTKAKT